MNRNNIKKIIEGLNSLSSNYNDFEVALMIFLRADLLTFNNSITNEDLGNIASLCEEYDSILNEDLKEQIDDILKSKGE